MIFYWNHACSVQVLDEKCIKIGKDTFRGIPLNLFYELYHLFNNGCSINDALKSCSKSDQNLANRFIQDLIIRRYLIHDIQSVDEMCAYSSKVYNANHMVSLSKSDPDLSQKTIEISIEHKKKLFSENYAIPLLLSSEFERELEARKSIRVFNKEVLISWSKFCKLLECLVVRYHDGIVKSMYPSAGAIYPISVYLYVKENRVETLKQGLYYYDPILNQLRYITDSKEFCEKNHYGENQKLYNQSAFSLFLVYNYELSYPKYEARSYFYGMVEAGIILELLSQRASDIGLGSCIVGILDFESVKSAFKLSENDVYLLSMEFGLPKD